MAPPNNIAAGQPLNAFFDIRCGGISNIFINPDTPVSFEIQLGAEPYMKAVLLDVSGKAVEPALYQSAQIDDSGYFDIQAQWGYTQPPLPSPVVQMKCKTYDVIFGKNLFYVVLHGEPLLDAMVSSNSYSGTALECIQKFCTNHGYTLQFDPQPSAANMMDVGLNDFDSTEPVERKHIKLANQSDMAFFKWLLTFLADGNSVVGYRAYFYPDQNGNMICKITNNAISGVAYTFDYPSFDSTVLDWRPKIEMAVLSGSGYSQVNANSPINGASQKTVLQPQLTQQFSGNKQPPIYNPKSNPPPKPATQYLQFMSSNAMEDAVKNSAVRVWHGGTLSPYGASNIHLDQHIAQLNSSMEAELEVLGDPTIQPSQLCQVNAYYPNSRELHYSSGTYYIKNVLHQIHNGEYRTTLYMWCCPETPPNQWSVTNSPP